MTTSRMIIWFSSIAASIVFSLVLCLYVCHQSRSNLDQFERSCAADFGAIELGIHAVNLDSSGSWLKDFEGTGKHCVADIASKRSDANVGMPSIDPSGSKYLFEVKQGVVYVYTGHPNEKLIGLVYCAHAN